MPPKSKVKPPAVAGAEYHEHEALAVGDLYDESVAEEMNAFIVDLVTSRKEVGTSAFLIFALRYRVRVRVLYGINEEDLLAAHAPWANTAISNNAKCHAVACRYTSDGDLRSLENGVRHMNHWVAAYTGSAAYCARADNPSLFSACSEI